jgi:hypothetical protein
MGRLHGLGVFLAFVFYLLSSPSPLAAKSYCSLTISVLNPKGQQIEVPIEVREKSGRTIAKQQLPTTGEVQFCDLGILPVDVAVGIEGCNQVSIRDVPLDWKEPYRLKVMYDPEPCLRDPPPAPKPYCKVLLRVADADGRCITKANIKFDKPGRKELLTDNAGRAFGLLTVKDTLSGAVSAPGYGVTTFSIRCTEVGNQEELVKLVRSK